MTPAHIPPSVGANRALNETVVSGQAVFNWRIWWFVYQLKEEASMQKFDANCHLYKKSRNPCNGELTPRDNAEYLIPFEKIVLDKMKTTQYTEGWYCLITLRWSNFAQEPYFPMRRFLSETPNTWDLPEWPRFLCRTLSMWRPWRLTRRESKARWHRCRELLPTSSTCCSIVSGSQQVSYIIGEVHFVCYIMCKFVRLCLLMFCFCLHG